MLSLSGRTALFCERTQQLWELNETARLAWRMLEQGRSCAAIAERLCEEGAAPADAQSCAMTILEGWLAAGCIAPLEVLDELAATPSAALAIRIGPLAAELRFFGAADSHAAASVFGHFAQVDGAGPHMRVSVVGRGGHDFLFVDGAPVGMGAPRRTPPALKALLTEEYCRSVRDGFLAHGGLVSANGKRVFIGGPPGAGKSTLVLALAAAGLAYGGDDIVHIDAQGAATGVPFAAAAKHGSWALLESSVPALSASPTYERSDGKLVRYVLPQPLDRDGPRRIDVVILLARAAGAEARLETIEPMGALCALLASGYAERGAIGGCTLAKLAENLSQAACYRLTYEAVPDAAALVTRRLDE